MEDYKIDFNIEINGKDINFFIQMCKKLFDYKYFSVFDADYIWHFENEEIKKNVVYGKFENKPTGNEDDILIIVWDKNIDKIDIYSIKDDIEDESDYSYKKLAGKFMPTLKNLKNDIKNNLSKNYSSLLDRNNNLCWYHQYSDRVACYIELFKTIDMSLNELSENPELLSE